MSVRVLSDVWLHSRAKGGNLLVLLALADYADEKGKCWPAIETIALKARMTDRHVRRVLRELEVSGDVTVDFNAGRAGSNVYWLTLGPERQKSLFPPGELSSPPDISGTKGGTPASVTPDLHAPQTVKEPSGNRQKEEEEIRALVAQTPALREDRFIAKWNEWNNFRRMKRKPISPAAAKKQLALLATLSTDDAVEAIDASIRNDWTGIFPPRKTHPTKGRAGFV